MTGRQGEPHRRNPRGGSGTRLLAAVAAVCLLVFGYFAFTFAQVWHASRQDDARPAEAIIVLGAAQFDGRPSNVLQARLDHAADLYDRKLAPASS